MERMTITTFDLLLLGDRFYRQDDKKKIVWTKVEYEKEREAHGRKLVNKFTAAQQDGEKYPVHLRGDTGVIFLRHQIQ